MRRGLVLLAVLLASQAAAAEIAVWSLPAFDARTVMPGDSRGSDQESLQLTLQAAPGEYEPATFVVEAGDDGLGQLTVTVSPLSDGDRQLPADAVDIKVVKRWPQSGLGVMSPKKLRYLIPELLLNDDALVRVEGDDYWVRLEDGEYRKSSDKGMKREFLSTRIETFPVRDAAELVPVTLDAGDNRQFWVTVHVPEDASAGLYTGQLLLTAEGGKEKSLPFSVRVLPFELADNRLESSIYYRAFLDRDFPDGSISSERKSDWQMLVELKNLVAHGVTNPTVYQPWHSGQLRRVLELREQAGISGKPLYYLGANAAIDREGNWPRGLEDRIEDVRRLAAEFGTDEVFIYTRDEAKGEELLKQKPVYEAVRKSGAGVFVAGYHTTAWTGPGNFDLMAEDHDVIVSIAPATPEESARWHGIDRRIFSYQNPTGGFELPDLWRRNYGLLLWQMDYDGGMPYAYQHSYADIWNDFDHYQYRDHNFTYPTIDGVIDTVSWEAFREGIDDLRYLATLQSRIEGAGDSAAAADAKAWLAELKALPLAQLNLDAVRGQMVEWILAIDGASADSSVRYSGDALACYPGRKPAETDLLAWWDFEEPVGDAYPSRVGEAELEISGDVQSGEGLTGRGVVLDGVKAYLEADGVSFGAPQQGTLEGWFRFDEFALQKGNSVGVFSGIYQHPINNYLYVQGTNEMALAASLLRRNHWHHIALTFTDDVTEAMLYVDGRPTTIDIQQNIEDMPPMEDPQIGRSAGMLGGLIGGPTGFFGGSIDEVRAWQRPLSADEITALYREGRDGQAAAGLTLPDECLVPAATAGVQ